MGKIIPKLINHEGWISQSINAGISCISDLIRGHCTLLYESRVWLIRHCRQMHSSWSETAESMCDVAHIASDVSSQCRRHATSLPSATASRGTRLPIAAASTFHIINNVVHNRYWMCPYYNYICYLWHFLVPERVDYFSSSSSEPVRIHNWIRETQDLNRFVTISRHPDWMEIRSLLKRIRFISERCCLVCYLFSLFLISGLLRHYGVLWEA